MNEILVPALTVAVLVLGLATLVVWARRGVVLAPLPPLPDGLVREPAEAPASRPIPAQRTRATAEVDGKVRPDAAAIDSTLLDAPADLPRVAATSGR
jgi:hypothetical protein